MKNEEFPFLHPNINIIRKSIKGIDESYSNFWDILAELTQNSVDAINRKESKTGNIEIEIDSMAKKIRVQDDGVGIETEKIPVLLCPFSTDKENEYDSIGEKGVGLKFVIFQSNIFNMKTSYLDSNKTSYVTIEGARNWKNSNTKEELYLHKTIKNDEFKGTEIIISDVDQEDIFNNSFETIKYIIRTKTVIGNVYSIFNDNENIKVNLKFRDNNNNYYEENIKYKYWLPSENVNPNKILSFSEYEEWLKITKRTDEEKRKKMSKKIIWHSKTIKHNDNREIKYWACVFPSWNFWNEVSIKDNLITKEIAKDKEKLGEYIQKMHQPGIYMSVKGMPTGIRIEKPMTGAAGYWGNLFIIFEDKNLNFDIGRKFINGNASKIYKEYAKEIFNSFNSTIFKYMKEERPEEEFDDWDRVATYNEITNKPTLNSNIVKFRNIPDYQEASVAAIFYQLIGSKHIKKIEPITTGYKDKYDLYAFWNSKFIVIEFKSKLRNIIDDFTNLIKLSNELDYIVCWDVNSEDINDLNDISVKIEKISPSVIKNKIKNNDDENAMPITTHKLIVSQTATPIKVIDLKVLLEILED